MTNREFLNSLSNEQFTQWLFGGLELNILDDKKRPIKSYESFNYVIMSFLNPSLEFKIWLSEERKGGV